MAKQEGFDPEYEFGVNLETLQKGKKWFQKYEDENIIKYKYCIDKDSKMKSNLNDEDFMECTICGKELYDINEDSKYNSESAANIVIDQKRHIVFIDKYGNEYPVCYRLSFCFKRADKPIDILSNTECDEAELEDLEFEDLAKNPSIFDDAFLISANEALERDVKPILKKWAFIEIGKFDTIDLIADLDQIEKFIIKYCDNKEMKDRFKSKLYNIIGIKYEK